MNHIERLRFYAASGLACFALSFAAGACFNGLDSEGLPCTDDSQCAVGQECIDGFCNGLFLCDDGAAIDSLFICDGVPDCPDNEDEAVDLCFGGEGELFECAGGEFVIPSDFLCDGELDCPDGGDELGCAGVGTNECSGGGPDIAFAAATTVSLPLTDPLPVVALDLIGPSSPEILTGTPGSDRVDAVSFSEDGSNTMIAPIGPFENGVVIGFDTGDVNGDGTDDIVVATSSDAGFSAHVFQNFAPDPPEAYGTPATIELPMAIVPEVRALELARLNNDSSIDMVAIVDGGDLLGTGRVMAGLGDSAAASQGGAYFTPELVALIPAINYDTFFDVAVGDFSDESQLDDVIVSGIKDGEPKLWLVVRTSVDADAWDGPFEVPGLMIPPAQLAVGAFNKELGPDLAILDPVTQRIQTIRNQNGMLVPGTVIEIAEAQPTGISLADVNCDGRDDLLFYQNQIVSVLLGDGMGGIYDPEPIRTELSGAGRGRIAVGEYNGDGTPDIVTTLDGGVQVLLSTGASPLGAGLGGGGE